MYLKPAPGITVPDPERGNAALAPEGREVELTQYWQRRMNDGDVLESTPVDAAAAASSAPKKSKE